MNRPVAPLSSNAFTAIPLWLSNFSSSTLIQTSLSGWSVHCISLTLSVVLVNFDLLPSFSRYNILYKLLEASQELTVLHFLLPTCTAFLLSFLCVFSNNFWLYGPTFHIYSMSYPSPPSSVYIHCIWISFWTYLSPSSIGHVSSSSSSIFSPYSPHYLSPSSSI